jgi:transcription-repair coupling factor (superfamily II helicase)
LLIIDEEQRFRRQSVKEKAETEFRASVDVMTHDRHTNPDEHCNFR